MLINQLSYIKNILVKFYKNFITYKIIKQSQVKLSNQLQPQSNQFKKINYYNNFLKRNHIRFTLHASMTSYFRNNDKLSMYKQRNPVLLPSIRQQTKSSSYVGQTNYATLTPKQNRSYKHYNHKFRPHTIEAHQTRQSTNSIGRFRSELELQSNTQSFYKSKLARLQRDSMYKEQRSQSLRRQIKQVKELLNYKMQEHNFKMEMKLNQLSLESRNRQSHPHVIFQPVPMMSPMMMPPMMPYGNGNYPQLSNQLPLQKSKRNLGRLFRKVVHVTLFTIYLRRFAQRVVKHRKSKFDQYIKSNEFKEQANTIKTLLLNGCKPFLKALLKNQEVELTLDMQNDSQKLKKEKFAGTKALLQILLKCIKDAVNTSQFNQVIRSIYYFCKHGSYACTHSLMTQEELVNISVSQKHYYLQAEKNLEKSQIISFIFFKILIYNGIGQPWKIDKEKFSKQKQILQENINLISTIFYELLMDIQDDYIVETPECYPIGNYKNLKGKSKVFPAESLTVKANYFRKNQMISGLVNEKYIKNTYKIQKLWTVERKLLIQIIDLIHGKIIKYHQQLIKPFF